MLPFLISAVPPCLRLTTFAAWLTASIGTAAPPASQVAAFPGAEGFGAASVGGRGGRVIEVTTLSDSGAGSLRAAIESEGPRTAVFRVSGVIELRSELVLAKPLITVAGQTAPGGGITLTNHPSNPRSILTIKGGAHDVIIRHLRLRPSPPARRENPNDDSHIQDALQILDASKVIIDHCSFSWATDEVVSTFSSAQDVTIQWSIVAEALRNTKRGGPDGKGMLLGGKEAGRISAHHNLLAHNIGRNPMIKAAGVVDLVNNIVLAPANVVVAVDGEYGKTPVNIIGNHVTAPNADGRAFGIRILGPKPVALFVADNFGPHRRSDEQPQDRFVDPGNNGRTHLVSQRHPAPAISTQSPAVAFERVLAQAGCTLPVRDTIDLRIVDDVRRSHARTVEEPASVGGLPAPQPGTPPADTDHDGMPDAWESRHQLNRNDDADGPVDADSDGYTNLEEFLNQTAPNRAEGAP